ncbi:MAG: ribonuclease P protein component 4 [Candidatus Woesearchaeota archaeon]
MQDANRLKANQRISELFVLAKDSDDAVLAKRYIVLARKIATRYRTRFSREQKVSFCKNCNAFLINGKNSSVRLSNGNIVLSCKECNFVRRFKFKK